jgi:hypothetical protein
MKHFLELIANPDVLALAAAVAALFLAKSKFFTERDFKRARHLLEMGRGVADAASRTSLTAREIRTQSGEAKSAAVRLARVLLRGWLR